MKLSQQSKNPENNNNLLLSLYVAQWFVVPHSKEITIISVKHFQKCKKWQGQ